MKSRVEQTNGTGNNQEKTKIKYTTMPNHVYHTISFNTVLSSDQKKILKEIEKDERGICGYYMPMPKDLIDTSSPSKILSQEEYDQEMQRIEKENPLLSYKPLTSTMSEELIANYGHNNWYDWANDDNNWGTKWGCYDTDLDGDVLHCSTAWGPFSDAVFEMLVKDFPNVEWHWEEEQGYGATIVVEDGEIIAEDDYDPIPWSAVGTYKESPDDQWGQTICYTVGRPDSMSTELVKPGFYFDYSEHEYIGETLPMEIYNQLTDEEREEVIRSYFK